MSSRRRGYMTERKIRLMFDDYGWSTTRSGASLGEADLICIKDGKCFLIQVKATKKKTFYYYDYMEPSLQGFPFYLVVDFGYGKIRVLHPQKKVTKKDGMGIKEFLRKM